MCNLLMSSTVSSLITHDIVEVVDGLININARFTSHITRLLLPLLLRRPRSLIMNISSAAEQGMPCLSVRSGTKSYITTWNKALTAGMTAENRNVEALGIVIGCVHTTNNSHPLSTFHPRAETFAKATMARVGCGKASVCGYLPHALQIKFLSFFPGWVARKVVIDTRRRLKTAADTIR